MKINTRICVWTKISTPAISAVATLFRRIWMMVATALQYLYKMMKVKRKTRKKNESKIYITRITTNKIPTGIYSKQVTKNYALSLLRI